MTRSLHPFFLMLLMATCLPDLSAKAFTPQPGTPLRTALMDAIRLHDFYPTRELARSNPKNILFQVFFLRVSENWVLANVLPLQDGKDFAEPRWNLIQKLDGEWRVVDHLDKIRKYCRNDAEFWGAIDMDAEAVARLQKEIPELPEDIYPN